MYAFLFDNLGKGSSRGMESKTTNLDARDDNFFVRAHALYCFD